ncbi:MAG: hypothetical protein M1338_05020 [Patescibacteria group bacterium]|nr:hypothetical protein [Patescibacteria group bacterium]
MQDKLLKIKNNFLAEIKEATIPAVLEQIEIKYLGRKAGELNNILRTLKDLPEDYQ